MSDGQSFDIDETLREYADHLNAIDEPADNPNIFFEIMSAALVWSDETRSQTHVHVVSALRPLLAFRTSLMLGKPSDEYRRFWESGMSLFPNWVGFCPTRREPSKELMSIYRRGEVKMQKCIREYGRMLDD